MDRYQTEPDRYQTEVTSRYTAQSSVSAFMSKVYAFMAGALAVTALTAYYVSQTDAITSVLFANRGLVIGLLVVELLLVIVLSARIKKMSYPVAAGVFLLYSLLNGVTLSSIFLVYAQADITAAFTATAGTFGLMSLLGYYTKVDLSRFGSILYMALIGLIVAMVVNMIWYSAILGNLITYGGVLIFVGLTAYDTQKIKRIAQEMDIETDSGRKVAILGALNLYLDFINLFLFLLRIMASRD